MICKCPYIYDQELGVGGFNTNVTHYDFAKPKLSTILILYVLLIKLKKLKTNTPENKKLSVQTCRQKETPTSYYLQDIH
jgi:hypothetical protein